MLTIYLVSTTWSDLFVSPHLIHTATVCSRRYYYILCLCTPRNWVAQLGGTGAWTLSQAVCLQASLPTILTAVRFNTPSMQCTWWETEVFQNTDNRGDHQCRPTSSLCRREKWSAERGSDLPKITEQRLTIGWAWCSCGGALRTPAQGSLVITPSEPVSKQHPDMTRDNTSNKSGSTLLQGS